MFPRPGLACEWLSAVLCPTLLPDNLILYKIRWFYNHSLHRKVLTFTSSNHRKQSLSDPFLPYSKFQSVRSRIYYSLIINGKASKINLHNIDFAARSIFRIILGSSQDPDLPSSSKSFMLNPALNLYLVYQEKLAIHKISCQPQPPQ